MESLLETTISKDEIEEIREIVSILILLPKDDRAILLSNANAFKVRSDIEKARRNDSKS